MMLSLARRQVSTRIVKAGIRATPPRQLARRWLGSSPQAVGKAAPAQKPRSLLRLAGRATGVVVVATGAGFGYRYATDEGTRRSVLFWGRAFPIYLHYRRVQKGMEGRPNEESDAAFNALHDEYAPVVKELVLELRGFYLKLAQTISTVDYFLPKQYLAWCKEMQDQAPAVLGPAEVRAAVVASMGLERLDDVFSEFDDVPVGAASIGQVHRARLKANGQEVAVKVQAPGIERKFRSDISTVTDFVKIAMPQHVEPMKEIEAQFDTEFDYRGEAQNLEDVYEHIVPVFGDRVAIPKPYPELCTKDVLVMEFFHGVPLIAGIKAFVRRVADAQGRPYEEVEAEHLERLRQGQRRDAAVEERRIRRFQNIMDARRAATNAAKAAYNWTLGFALPNAAYSEREVLLNVAGVIRLVAEVTGHAVVVNGCFNSDPHPGNIMLLDDGRVGLIDYGQTKRLPDDLRLLYAKLIVALADCEDDRAIEIIHEMGIRSKYNDPEVRMRLMRFWHDSHTEVLQGLNIQEFMDDMESRDPSRALPRDLVFPGRASILIRGMGNAFGVDLRMAQLWRPAAMEALRVAEAQTVTI